MSDTDTINRRCKYCQPKLKVEHLVLTSHYGDNPKCPIRPITEYSEPSIAIYELKEITMDTEEL